MAPISITKESLRGVLSKLDRTDPAATEQFLNLLTDACSTAKDTVPASAMTESSTPSGRFNARTSILPLTVERVLCLSALPSLKSLTNTVLEDALNKIAEFWHTESSEAACRIFLEILITGCLWHLRQQSPDVSSTLTPPCKPPLRLKAFGEVTLKYLVHGEHDYILSGRADFAIGYGPMQQGESPALDTYLTLVEAKHAGTFGAAWPQMMAYLGMVHQTRIARAKPNATVYGICSDGMKYLFARVDNQGQVWKSKELNIVQNRDLVYSYVLHILSAAVLSTPTTSPTKSEQKKQRQVENFEVQVVSRFFQFGKPTDIFEDVGDEDAEDFVMY